MVVLREGTHIEKDEEERSARAGTLNACHSHDSERGFHYVVRHNNYSILCWTVGLLLNPKLEQLGYGGAVGSSRGA